MLYPLHYVLFLQLPVPALQPESGPLQIEQYWGSNWYSDGYNPKHRYNRYVQCFQYGDCTTGNTAVTTMTIWSTPAATQTSSTLLCTSSVAGKFYRYK